MNKDSNYKGKESYHVSSIQLGGTLGQNQSGQQQRIIIKVCLMSHVKNRKMNWEGIWSDYYTAYEHHLTINGDKTSET